MHVPPIFFECTPWGSWPLLTHSMPDMPTWPLCPLGAYEVPEHRQRRAVFFCRYISAPDFFRNPADRHHKWNFTSIPKTKKLKTTFCSLCRFFSGVYLSSYLPFTRRSPLYLDLRSDVQWCPSPDLLCGADTGAPGTGERPSPRHRRAVPPTHPSFPIGADLFSGRASCRLGGGGR